ncbi:hypothetical protein AHiyo1_09150 [Arthrobacter sp. Hiyo1]|uniref:hypothetical protein n=1 Tax=Arthrobacter sp. Hiyo1 TaxID=1588020 RepID=UPI0007236F3B|nr:hypothetical protein [Arthrobacter sp. Hiyo1]GAP57953.1 hypothetical protein AHiyo1_09150 [Arthrobacter sp. Hiyo1]
MTDREFLQLIIRRVAADLKPEAIRELAATMPVNKTQATVEFEEHLANWFGTECVVNDVNLAWELLETVKNAETGVLIIKTKEADASENN